jgi:hypothetical protein
VHELEQHGQLQHASKDGSVRERERRRLEDEASRRRRKTELSRQAAKLRQSGGEAAFTVFRVAPTRRAPSRRNRSVTGGGKRPLLGSMTLADPGRAGGPVSTSRGGRPLIDLTEVPLGDRFGHPGHRLTTPPIAMVVRIVRLLAGSPEPRRYVSGTDPRLAGWLG